MVRTLKFISTHPLTSDHPIKALWRYVKWQINSRVCPEVEFRWIEGSKLIVRGGMTGATGNIYCGLHEFFDMGFLLHMLRPNDLFVDVGANIGSYTILASAVCGAYTIAIEPDPGTMHFLNRNVQANAVARFVTLKELAVAATGGRLAFTVGRDTTNRVATTTDSHTRFVNVSSLDELLEGVNPVLIKLDVEGYEPQVIKGANMTLRKPSLLAVQLESVDEATRRQLQSAGFEQAQYDPFQRNLSVPAKRKATAAANMLFVRDLHACRARLASAPVRRILGHDV